MKDRRSYPANQNVAYVSLCGQIDGVSFTKGTSRQICVGVADLLAAPDQGLDRQLIFGDDFLTLETGSTHSFGIAADGNYVGYVANSALGAPHKPTHRVVTRAAHIYPQPNIKTIPRLTIPFNAQVSGSSLSDDFLKTPFGFIPAQSLLDVTQTLPDPAETARSFLGTPYLWGGDSVTGIDCSGLVHAAFRAAGVPCPRDSDQQLAAFGQILPPNSALERNDLVFWSGHVGLMLDDTQVIHANAHAMAVTVEPLADVNKRIQTAKGGPVTGLKRV